MTRCTCGAELPPRRRRGVRAGIDWNAQPLGDMSDADLGRRLGCDRRSVTYQRERRGIPAYAPSSCTPSDRGDLLTTADRLIAAGKPRAAITVLRHVLSSMGRPS